MELLLSDQPIDQEINDTMRFSSHVRNVIEKALSMKGPYTVGIYGEWGSGKSSFLELIIKAIEEPASKEHILVKFDAWLYEQEEHPLIPIIGLLIKEIERKNIHFEQIKKLKDVLQRVACALSIRFKAKVPQLAEVDFQISPKEILDKKSELLSDSILGQSTFYGLYDSLNKIVEEANIKIIVIIDDLDRCTPARALKILESIKLILWHKNFYFFLGVNKKILDEYVNKKFRQDYGLNEFSIDHYLDKLVHLPVNISDLEGVDVDAFIESLVDSLKEIEAYKDLVDAFEDEQTKNNIKLSCSGNPRRIKQVINNIIFNMGLS